MLLSEICSRFALQLAPSLLCLVLPRLHLNLTRAAQGHRPRDAIDVDAAEAAPAPSSPSPPAAAPRRRPRLSQISGLDPWAQQAFVHAGEGEARSAAPLPTSDGTER